MATVAGSKRSLEIDPPPIFIKDIFQEVMTYLPFSNYPNVAGVCKEFSYHISWILSDKWLLHRALQLNMKGMHLAWSCDRLFREVHLIKNVLKNRSTPYLELSFLAHTGLIESLGNRFLIMYQPLKENRWKVQNLLPPNTTLEDLETKESHPFSERFLFEGCPIFQDTFTKTTTPKFPKDYQFLPIKNMSRDNFLAYSQTEKELILVYYDFETEKQNLLPIQCTVELREQLLFLVSEEMISISNFEKYTYIYYHTQKKLYILRMTTDNPIQLSKEDWQLIALPESLNTSKHFFFFDKDYFVFCYDCESPLSESIKWTLCQCPPQKKAFTPLDIEIERCMIRSKAISIGNSIAAPILNEALNSLSLWIFDTKSHSVKTITLVPDQRLKQMKVTNITSDGSKIILCIKGNCEKKTIIINFFPFHKIILLNGSFHRGYQYDATLSDKQLQLTISSYHSNSPCDS